ncbi:MAG: hypothetical protein M3380_10445, partial [Chloroflexota bacterium]|nr:hypothetical protein [Chloroflexota bacterium]
TCVPASMSQLSTFLNGRVFPCCWFTSSAVSRGAARAMSGSVACGRTADEPSATFPEAAVRIRVVVETARDVGGNQPTPSA